MMNLGFGMHNLLVTDTISIGARIFTARALARTKFNASIGHLTVPLLLILVTSKVLDVINIETSGQVSMTRLLDYGDV